MKERRGGVLDGNLLEVMCRTRCVCGVMCGGVWSVCSSRGVSCAVLLSSCSPSLLDPGVDPADQPYVSTLAVKRGSRFACQSPFPCPVSRARRALVRRNPVTSPLHCCLVTAQHCFSKPLSRGQASRSPPHELLSDFLWIPQRHRIARVSKDMQEESSHASITIQLLGQPHLVGGRQH